MDQYRIAHMQYFNEKAVVTMEHWIVEEWKRGVVGYSWKTLGHYDYVDSWTPTEFKSLDDACECIERLKDGTARSKWVRKLVSC